MKFIEITFIILTYLGAGAGSRGLRRGMTQVLHKNLGIEKKSKLFPATALRDH